MDILDSTIGRLIEQARPTRSRAAQLVESRERLRASAKDAAKEARKRHEYCAPVPPRLSLKDAHKRVETERIGAVKSLLDLSHDRNVLRVSSQLREWLATMGAAVLTSRDPERALRLLLGKGNKTGRPRETKKALENAEAVAARSIGNWEATGRLDIEGAIADTAGSPDRERQVRRDYEQNMLPARAAAAMKREKATK